MPLLTLNFRDDKWEKVKTNIAIRHPRPVGADGRPLFGKTKWVKKVIKAYLARDVLKVDQDAAAAAVSEEDIIDEED